VAVEVLEGDVYGVGVDGVIIMWVTLEVLESDGYIRCRW
jgi:hypothetical protein